MGLAGGALTNQHWLDSDQGTGRLLNAIANFESTLNLSRIDPFSPTHFQQSEHLAPSKHLPSPQTVLESQNGMLLRA